MAKIINHILKPLAKQGQGKYKQIFQLLTSKFYSLCVEDHSSPAKEVIDHVEELSQSAKSMFLAVVSAYEMQCLAPVNIPRPNGLGNTDRIEVPCGKCAGCLDTRRTDWTNRLNVELLESTSAHFITLTYDDECLLYAGDYPTLEKRDLQLFMKRLRKNSINKLRYYAVGEYGTNTYRPHYHIILFNLCKTQLDIVQKSWSKGFVHVGTVTGASIHYVTKYHLNRSDYIVNTEPPFALMSRNPGIGYQYVQKYASYHSANVDHCLLAQRGNVKTRLPRYYKDKLYTPYERQLIAIQAKRMQSKLKRQKIEDYLSSNDGNYYEYEVQQKEQYIKNYKQKSNLKNRL